MSREGDPVLREGPGLFDDLQAQPKQKTHPSKAQPVVNQLAKKNPPSPMLVGQAGGPCSLPGPPFALAPPLLAFSPLAREALAASSSSSWSSTAGLAAMSA